MRGRSFDSPAGINRPSKSSRWLPLAAWMALIFLFSTDLFSGEETGGFIIPILGYLLGWLFSEPSLTILHSLIRKGAHLMEYAVVGLLWYRAINSTLKGWNSRAAFLALLLSSLYAVSDEIHQTLTLTREGRAADVMIDSVGALTAIAGIWHYNRLLIGAGINAQK